MIMFKECLNNGYIPVLIKDENKNKYRLALNKAVIENIYRGLG